MSGIAVPARRRCLALLAAGGMAVLAGCAQPPRSASDAQRSDFWSGRLAVQVEGDAARSFSAGFSLSGSASAGDLMLYTPLGNALAELRWTPGQAVLKQGDQERASTSLQQLARDLTGVDLPVEALFSWLHGDAVQAAGWQADLSRLQDGRLVATRHTPEPQATLRVVLER